MGYPTNIDSFTPKVDDTNDVMAADVNNLQTAVVALQTKVGVDNSAVETTIEYKVAAKENSSNKVTSLSAGSTDDQYPSAKLVYDQLATKQAAGSYETTTNKETSALDTSTTKYPCNNVVKTAVDEKISASSTDTLTNKRINPRLVTAASYTTDTGTSLDFSTCDEFVITAQAGDLKFNNPSGTPVNGQKIIIRVKDNGTARNLTYDTQYRAVGVTLPTTTVVNKTTYIGGIWNSDDTKLDVVAVATEA